MNQDLINATDLAQWADRKEAESLLPELLNRLVYASVTPEKLEEATFPSLEGVNSGGWDGETRSKGIHTYVPKGHAGWEMGKNKDKKTKADKDYTTRTEGIAKKDRMKMTFVFVTPRRWSSKSVWLQEKRAEAEWKDIRVLDAENLIPWLVQHPAVHRWITEIIKGPNTGVVSGDAFWDKWSTATSPVIDPSFLLAGRKKAAEELAAELTGKKFSKVVHARSADEATAFILCTIMALPKKLKEPLMSRVLVVETEYAYNQLIETQSPLILIPLFNQPNVMTALDKGHTVLLPAGPAKAPAVNTVSVSRLNVDEAAKILQGSGVGHERSYELARLARKSLPAFRRAIATHPEILTPQWIGGERGAELVPALLLGSWKETNEQDKKIVEELTGTSYDQYEKQLVGWSLGEDAPVEKQDSVWRVISVRDAADATAKFITSEQRATLSKIALGVLSSEDPSFDLPVDERWLSNIKGYTAPYSSELRHSMASSIAELATHYGDVKPAAGQVTFQQIADYVVGELLAGANADTTGKKWYSLRDVLPALAEASPEKFLDEVEKGLRGDEPALSKMFIDDNGQFSSSPHVNLLFALEAISWSKAYLSRVVLAFSRLVELDPGGTTSNTPFNSLLHILSLVRPQTTANDKERLQLIDLISDRFPEVGYKLLLDLIPRSQTVHFGNASPKFRSWKPESLANITYGELYRMISEVVSRLLKMVKGIEGARWTELLERLTDLPIEDFEKVVGELSNVPKSGLSDEDKATIWHEIRAIISRHREFPDAKWSYPPAELNKLEDIYHALTPAGSARLYSWLFAPTHEVHLLNPDGHNWLENNKLIKQLRQDAASKVYVDEAMDGVLNLARRSEDPYALGFSLPILPADDEDGLLGMFSADDSKIKEVVRGYIVQRSFSDSNAWVLRKLEERKSWHVNLKADFLLALPASRGLWNEVEAMDDEIQQEYWKKVGPYGLGADFKDYDYAARKYLAVDRPHEAIVALTYVEDKDGIESQLMIDSLTAAAKVSPLESSTSLQMLSYNVGQLLKQLAGREDVDKDVLVGLEVTWFPAIRTERDDYPLQLHKKLSSEPEFFVELISYKYKKGSASKKIPSKLVRQKAELASDILESWHDLPGLNEDRTVDYPKLHAWITTSMELLKAADRTGPGEYHIGELLYYSPPSVDGKWPSDEVCQLLDEVPSERMEDGLSDQAFNSFGFISREEDDGPQRAEALDQRASELDFTLPRAAKILRRVANSLRSRTRHLFHDDDEV